MPHWQKKKIPSKTEGHVFTMWAKHKRQEEGYTGGEEGGHPPCIRFSSATGTSYSPRLPSSSLIPADPVDTSGALIKKP